jgi:hypothetical protein
MSVKAKAILNSELEVQKGSVKNEVMEKLELEKEKKSTTRKTCMFYPTEDFAKDAKSNPLDEFKNTWDLCLVLVLIFSSLMSPYRLAFVEEDDTTWKVINTVVDLVFGIDILVVFNTAYYDDDYKIVEDRKVIATTYMKGWFIIDFGAIVPFEFIFGSIGSYNGLIKIARIGRLYKLLKLTRMLRVFKFVKNKNKLFKYANQYLKISKGFERIFLFLCGFFLICHVVGCIWVILAKLEDLEKENSWLTNYLEDYDKN